MSTKCASISKIYYHTTFQDPKVSVDSVVSTSSFRASPMLLLVVSNDNARRWNVLNQNNVHTKFREVWLAGL
jgi:hypothetical protein